MITNNVTAIITKKYNNFILLKSYNDQKTAITIRNKVLLKTK